MSPKHNLEHCQGQLLDITSHQAFPSTQISSGLKGSQERSFSERTVLKHTNHRSAGLPPREEGSVHPPPGHRPAALRLAAAPPSSHHEHNNCLLKQRIKSSLRGKPRHKALLQWLIRVLSTGKTEPHLIYKLSFWLSIIKTIVAMAIQGPVTIYARLMSCLCGDAICRPSLVCARTEENVT